MADDNTTKWKRWYHKNCANWSEADKRRYLNVVNDPDEVDDIELESARELIESINKKPPVD